MEFGGFLKFSERGTTFRTEIIADLTTFMTMAYIIFVNPAILGTLAGIVLTGVGGMIFGIVPPPEGIMDFRFDTSTIGVLALPQVLQLSLIPAIFALFMTDFFDTMGTVIAVGQQGKLLDENGRPPQLKSILPIDSLGAVGGGATGASSVTSYIVSGAGAAVLFVLTFVWRALQKLFS